MWRRPARRPPSPLADTAPAARARPGSGRARAGEGTRTPTSSRTPGPKPGAAASYATPAGPPVPPGGAGRCPAAPASRPAAGCAPPRLTQPGHLDRHAQPPHLLLRAGLHAGRTGYVGHVAAPSVADRAGRMARPQG